MPDIEPMSYGGFFFRQIAIYLHMSVCGKICDANVTVLQILEAAL